MLKVVSLVNNRRTLFLGLSRENTMRLHDDQPIAIDLQAMTAGMDPVQDVVIYAAENSRDLHDKLAAAGLEMPPYVEPQPGAPVIIRGPR